MIQITKSYTANGKVFATITEAQSEELTILLGVSVNEDSVKAIIGNADKIVDILTTKPTSKPTARRVNGGTKKRKASTPVETPAI